MNGSGTIFAVNSDGAVDLLYSFSRADYSTGTNLDGYYPSAGVVQASDGNFYGVTMNGGLHGMGSIFRFTLLPDPPLFKNISVLGGKLSFSWTALQGARYQLQHSKDLASTNWLDLGSPITATGPLGTASDSIASDPQRFYRIVLLQ